MQLVAQSEKFYFSISSYLFEKDVLIFQPELESDKIKI